MAKSKREVSWKDVKSVLASQGEKELLKLLQDLYALSDENKRFIDTRCGLGGSLKPFKDQIETCMFPDDDEIDIAGAKKAISEYRKATDDPIGTLDLMIHFVECGTRYTLNYGDMWEEFYDSLESMFSRAAKMLQKMDERSIQTFLPRLEKMVRDTDGMGWGYHDGLTDIFFRSLPRCRNLIVSELSGKEREVATMPITHTNRRGQTYYLHQGKTKTGKDKFFVSMKADGELAERLPDDFEIYENPNAQVIVRKRLDSLIQPEELEAIRQILASQPHLHSYDYKVDHDRTSITVHLINENPQEYVSYLAPHRANERTYEDYAHRSGTYSPMMRFKLRDEKKRLFSVERFCFKGSVDDWIYLPGQGELKPLASKFLQHLGRESFFDLM